MPEPFTTYRRYLTERYGAPLHRVPIDLGFGCPNRNPDGTGGCAFCPADGGRADITAGAETVEEQIERGIAFARRRYGAEQLMAYVQAFSGTFAPASVQRERYARILAAYPFRALSVGTRPDCLPPETLSFLDELRGALDVGVELGVQTTHDATLDAVNRGHTWAASRAAIETLAARGITVAAHVILGLPGETREHFRRTAVRLSELPVAAVKIHNLHVVRGTALAATFERAPFPVYDEEAYAAILIDFLRHLRPSIAIMRLTTDTPAARLVAPRWTLSKGAFRERLVRTMTAAGHRQGDALTAFRTA